MAANEAETDVAVIGGGPGGYTAAFHAADLGLKVTLINDEDDLGGVCLLRGCIPSKALLTLCEIVENAEMAKDKGIAFSAPRINRSKVCRWKDRMVDQLAKGLAQLCERRNIRRIAGRARFTGKRTLEIEGGEASRLRFRHAIVATGSHPLALSNIEIKPGGRIMDSTGALALAEIPDKLLVVGGGYVGLELGQVYATLGSRVTLVEATDRLMGNVDRDLVTPLQSALESRFEAIHFNTTVSELRETEKRVRAILAGDKEGRRYFDRVLVAVNRVPNTEGLGLEDAEIEVDEEGFIRVDDKRRSTNASVFAIGDAAGGMMLAHEAMHAGKVAAEVIAGYPAGYDVRAVPAVVYTHPQIAWCGLTEPQAKAQDIEVEISRFSWRASGRALTLDANSGMTKLVMDPETGVVLGVGIVGPQAENLIAEAVHAIEMGATATDLALTMHPHPTLSETLGGAAQKWLGSATEL